MKNIGQQVIEKQDGTRIILSVYSDNGTTGYVQMPDREWNGKTMRERVNVQVEGWVDGRQLKQLWKVR